MDAEERAKHLANLDLSLFIEQIENIRNDGQPDSEAAIEDYIEGIRLEALKIGTADPADVNDFCDALRKAAKLPPRVPGGPSE